MTYEEFCKAVCKWFKRYFMFVLFLDIKRELEEMRDDSTRKISGEKVNKESD